MSKAKFFNYKGTSKKSYIGCGPRKIAICPPRVLSAALE